MIKELNNLKVRAIAIRCPMSTESISIENYSDEYGNYYRVLANDTPIVEKLLERPFDVDKYRILGRAHKLTERMLIPLYYSVDINYDPLIAPSEKEWKSYCTANGLTNELILIHPTNSR